MLPQPFSLSLSFLPLCQLNPVFSPFEVSIPALAALPCSCSFADRSCQPQTLWETISELCLQNHGEEGTGGGQSPLQSFAVGEPRGAMLAQEKLTILLLLGRMPLSTCRGF